MSAVSGGPAFPEAVAVTPAGTRFAGAPGMTLRDYCAIHADAPWQVVVDEHRAQLGRMPTFAEVVEGMAVLRYMMADAMIAERAK